MPDDVEFGMIDIHSHVLPGLDDGPRDIEEAIRMCSIASDEGITQIVATPHHLNGVYSNPKESIAEAVASLNEALTQQNIAVNVLPGSDVHLCSKLLEELKAGRVMTLNDGGKFMLLELPSFFVPAQVREQVFQLKLMGVTPIITHPERNNTAMQHSTLLQDLVRAGALMQLTAGSIVGDFGSGVKRNSLLLIHMRMAHIVATDAHNSTTRPPRMAGAINILSDILGKNEALMAVSARPASILAGIMPSINKPQVPKKKRTLLSMLGLGKRRW